MRKGLTELYLPYGVLIRVSTFSILHSNLLCSSCISSHRHVCCISDGFFIVVIKVYVKHRRDCFFMKKPFERTTQAEFKLVQETNVETHGRLRMLRPRLRVHVRRCLRATSNRHHHNHCLAHQAIAPPTASVSAPVPRGPKLERPKVDVGVTTEEWNVFVRRWDVFRARSGIDDTSAPSQLFQCVGTELGDSPLKVNANPVTDTVTQLLASMRSLAVIPVATGVLRTELLQLRQERDETFWAFAARVRGKAETCDFIAACECRNNVDYTSHVIRDVLLSGISDPDIRREVLGTSGILKKAVNDVIALVENKEMARNALPSSTMSAVSSFQRRNETLAAPTTTTTTTATPPQTDKGKRAPCPDCKQPFNLFSGWNSKPHQVCINCYKSRRRKNRPQRTPSAPYDCCSGRRGRH